MARIVYLLLSVLIIACSPAHNDDLGDTQNHVSWLSGQGEFADPNHIITFPKDHLAHPSFDIEWWYLTANLQDEANNRYALQWTLFRFRDGGEYLPWIDGHVFMGHASLHTPKQHFFQEKFAGAGLGNAGIKEYPLEYFIDHWRLRSAQENTLFPAILDSAIITPNGNAHVKLALSSNQAFILHGKQGYSRKTANASHASHYYSQPFLEAEGSIELAGKQISVQGKAWYDHEWSSQLNQEGTLGWDWFAIHLNNGNKLMAFRMRVANEDYITGTFINQSGQSETLYSDDLALDVLTTESSHGRKFPNQWRLTIKKHGIDIIVTTDKVDAFNPAVFSYYEGPTTITGSHQGIGFLELTGY